ncbi:NAD(P)/FAD-dependent oxidoreductase [Lichenicola sp.]|uniref:NAD(P)/FAD-dependent oxidoreductase n=1 Tax=Lichenicola sp. TaxID=2804529 RepID=UPI003AFFCFC7
MRIAVIGAGLAGLACAAALQAAGASVTLFDKARGAGGRLSTRRIDTPSGEASFDHGAQYFTAHDPAFQAEIDRWAALGLAAPWPAAGADAWVGTPTMNAPARQLASGLDVHLSSRIDALRRNAEPDPAWWLRIDPDEHGPFDAVVVAVPAEQAAPLLEPWDSDFADLAGGTRSRACWTVMVAFGTGLSETSDVLQHHGPIGWAARNSAKPGRTGPESWVIQAEADWSDAHLENRADTVLAELLAAFEQAPGVDLPAPLAATAHRWRYARSGDAGKGSLWNARLGLGVCGDWLLGPRVECAWLSGTRLAASMLAGPA